MNRLKYFWIKNRVIGKGKKVFYMVLCKIYGFDKWHIYPINEKPYAVDMLSTVNDMIKKENIQGNTIVEIGCGKGDLVGNIKWGGKKYGYDLSENVLRAGRFLHPKTQFIVGTFEDVNIGDISICIMTNFIHTISYDDLKSSVRNLLEKNNIYMFIFDTFSNREGTEYEYSHDGNYLFDGKYRMLKKSGKYVVAHGALRQIEYWVKI